MASPVALTPPPPYAHGGYAQMAAPLPFFTAPRPDYGYVPVYPSPYAPMQPAPLGIKFQPPAPPPHPTLPPGCTLNGSNLIFENGSNYLFSKQHTSIYYFLEGHQPWAPTGDRAKIMRLVVPTSLTVQDLILQLGVGDPKVHGVSECLELGDGGFLKGQSFMLGDNKSKQTLAALGWNESRGNGRRPVWIAVNST